MNWSYLRQYIGDLQRDEEYNLVKVMLADGRILEALCFEYRNGELVLVLKESADPQSSAEGGG